MQISTADRAKIIREITKTTNSTSLLNLMRRLSGEFSWEFIDFFLFSDDLDSFFFPPGTRGEPDNKLRNIFNQAITDFVEPASILNKAETLQSILSEKTGKNLRILPLKMKSSSIGFLVLIYPEEAEIGTWEITEAEFTASLCEIALLLHFEQMENEKKSLENNIIKRKFIQVENLKLLGEMVGGITHEFNNILTGVIGFAQLIEMSTRDEEILDSILEISKASERGKNIISYIAKTKKIDANEESQRLDIAEEIKNSANNVRFLLTRERSGIDVSEFFQFDFEEMLGIDLPPNLIQQLFTQIFIKMIKTGAFKIKVVTKKTTDLVIVEISFIRGDIPERLPVTIKNEEEFPGILFLYTLADKLHFDFKVEEMTLTLNFYTEKVPKKTMDFTHLAGKKVFAYEPDEIIAKMYQFFFKKIMVEGKVTSSRDELKKFLTDEIAKFQFIIIDTSAFPLLKSLQIPPRQATIILASAWGEYLDMSELENSPVTRLLLKPFNLKTLAMVLKRPELDFIERQ